MSFDMNLTKTELTAMKYVAETLGNHFGKAFNKDEFNENVNQRMKIKMTGGNMLAFMRLKDTYEISFELDMDESYLVEYFGLIVRAVPLIGGLLNVVKELKMLDKTKCEVLEREIVDLDDA
jgi:hypothetical protein